MKVLEVQNLTKDYGRIRALDRLSMSVDKGEVHGILGPNGSGKTTLLGIVTGILKANEGNFQWFEGQDKRPMLRIGALLETPNFYPYLNAAENLKIVARIKNTDASNLNELLELVNLHERKNSKFRTYSLGMKQRLSIAATLIGDPDVLILDEPSNGLDPQGIFEIRETILQIAAEGKTILMASHILNEVEKTCSHVSILRKGKLLASGTVGSVINNDVEVILGASDIETLRSTIKQSGLSDSIQVNSGRISFFMSDDISPESINKLLFEKGIVLNHLEIRQKSLEQEFLEITAQNEIQ